MVCAGDRGELRLFRGAEALYTVGALGGCLAASFGRGGVLFSLVLQNTCSALFLGGLVYGTTPALFRLLDTAALKHLGRISYSFYLLHLPIAILLAEQLFRVLPVPIVNGYPLAMSATLWLIMTPVTIVLASWQYRWVEQSGIALARTFTGKLRRHE